MSGRSKLEVLLEEAWDHRRVGKYDKARDLVEQAEALAGEDDQNVLGRIYHVYAQFEADHDIPEKALDLYKKSLGFYKRAANSEKIAHSTRHIADLERKLGNDEESERRYRESIEIYRNNPHTKAGDLANALAGFAQILEKRGKAPQAIAAWQETRELYDQCGIQAGVEQAEQKIESLNS